MEIVDYLRVARKRVALLILVPLLAVIAAAGYVLLTPAEYSGTATVSTNALVGGPSSPFTGSQGTNQFVAAFAASATGPAVIAAAARDVQLPTHQLSSGLSVSQKGSSSDMSVKFSSGNKNSVTPTLKAIVTETLKAMFSSQVKLASQQVTGARDALAESSKALVSFSNKYHVADPTLLYQAQLTRLNGLLQQQANLQASGKSLGALSMDPAIASVRGELKQFNEILPLYNTLSASQQAAVNALSSAQDAYRAAQAQLDLAGADSGIFVSQVQPVSRTATLIRTLIPVLGLGIFLAVVAVAILEMLSSTGKPVESARTLNPVVPEASKPTLSE